MQNSADTNQSPQNPNPKPFSDEWYQQQIEYTHRWKYRWYHFKRCAKPIIKDIFLFIIFLLGIALPTLLLGFVFDVPEDSVTPLFIIICICCLISFAVGKHIGKKDIIKKNKNR